MVWNLHEIDADSAGEIAQTTAGFLGSAAVSIVAAYSMRAFMVINF